MTEPRTGQQTRHQTGRRQIGRRGVVLALGSNLGHRLATLQAGVDHLSAAPGLRVTAVSAVFETAPVGGPAQPDYLNAVLLAESELPAMSILRLCQDAEQALGRVRDQRWGPRTLDVDLIACDDEVSSDPELTLPHPRAHERAFVLLPWLDVDAGAHLVGFGPVADLLAQIDQTGVTRLAAEHSLKLSDAGSDAD
ncbi:MAG TPA: 2-amino-4-hydroxy-6-hydroxymethyldihydropteridine diphosphokinase [Streptosporangiaceae bacterium]|nr:2-amino-4-hydroxy-6-hydroxymethyldihydropteridine diphosphokinase [Streptosporangiaceae bacterium]